MAYAFAFYHDWSHRAAYEQTARETAETVGIDWGGGIYFNYALLLLWAADVAWWWAAPRSFQSRPRALAVGFPLFVAFMAFNAAVVFETGPIRYAGLAASALLALAALRRRGLV